MALQPLQIVSSDSNTISVNLEDLRSLLTSEAVKDKYISIISIAGPSRQGKSFVLNFFLSYLRAEYVEKTEVSAWLTRADGKLKGFSWAPGSKRHTTGILIWPEAFFAKLKTGEEVAIFVLDTQGSFDNKSTVDTCAKIFALSTYISSVQLYNVMRGIKQYDLSHIQCFADYGSMLTDQNHSACFQNLCFLVRDWPNADEHPYGELGGHSYLEETWTTDLKELKDEINNFKNLFKKINCFLLPYPGRLVDGRKEFNGNLNEIEDDFKEQVKDLAVNLLSPHNLVLKIAEGEKLKAGDLICFIEEYAKILEDESLPKMEIFYTATIEAYYSSAKSRAFEIYVKNMDVNVKDSDRIYNEPELVNLHYMSKKYSYDYYLDFKKFDDVTVIEKYLQILKQKMDDEFHEYDRINRERMSKR